MQKFVVKKSKSAPLAPSSSQPMQLKPTVSNDEKMVPQNTSTALINSTEPNAVCKSDVTIKQPVTKLTKTTSSPSTTSHVKMSGYLKKKRNVRPKNL